jgi:hypothetical protein
MQTVDYNWQSLKEEDKTLPEKQPHKMMNADDIKVVQWHNNPKQQKMTWRESMSPCTAWIDVGDSKGLWRSQENRLYEELQYEILCKHYGQGYKIIKSTARSENKEEMINVKIIQIEQYREIKEVILILDGTRVYTGKQGKVKEGIRWSFKDSVNINTLI